MNLNILYFDALIHKRNINANLKVSYWTVDDFKTQQLIHKEEVQYITTNIVP